MHFNILYKVSNEGKTFQGPPQLVHHDAVYIAYFN